MMQTRRAMLVEPGRFEIENVAIAPQPGEVLVRMTACGLCNWELGHWRGQLGAAPMSLGHEGCGEIVELGKDVSRLRVGDAVTGLPDSLCCFADYFILREAMAINVTRAPEPGLTLGEPLVCIQNVVRTAQPQAGDIVVVVGCGPMGLWCIQNLAGAIPGALVAVDIDPAKLDLAKRYGATLAITPRTHPPGETLLANCGRLADVVIEGTGKPAGIAQAIDLLASGGHLVVMSSFESPALVDLMTCCAKHLRIDFAHPGIFGDTGDCLRRVEACVNRGVYRFGEVITHRFPLESIQEAFSALEHKPVGYLKGVVTP